MYRSEEEIKRNMLRSVNSTEDKSQNSLIHDAISPAAIEFALMGIDIKDIRDKQDVENLLDDELERFIYQRTGLKRKQATKSITKIIISGQEGAGIKEGNLVATDTVNFKSLEGKVIGGSGTTSVMVECEEYGAVGNVPADSIIIFPVTIPGLIDVYNPDTVTNGYAAETDPELRGRYYEKLQRPAKAGNKYHYEQWAKEVPGVGGVKIVPRWDGPLTVKAIIIDSNGAPADEYLIDDTFNHIEEERPFGAIVTVVDATPKEINVLVSLTLSEGYKDEGVKEVISDNIKRYLKSVAFQVAYISYAQIGSIILDTKGVLDYTDLKVNGSISNVSITGEEVAIVGGVS